MTSFHRRALTLALWTSGLALVHTYILYPVVLTLVARITDAEQDELPSELPTVALVVAAYNEENVITEKIENSFDLNYPSEKLNIVVFSDASSDGTDAIVESYADRGVELVRIEGRVGKTACQNAIAERIEEDIIVFSDANSMYEDDALTELVRYFDSDVGCVVGELRYSGGGVEGESAYWRYERFLKRLESTFGSIVTGNGSIYAVRSSAYVPLSADAISDFAEPLALVERGYRVTYAPTAVAWEHTSESVESELGRRIRIGTRAWNTAVRYPNLLNPFRQGVFSFKLLSHKVFRWLSPVFLLTLSASSVALVFTVFGPFYLWVVGMQAAFYGCAILGAVGDRFGWRTPSLFHVPYYFLVSNYGMGCALVNFLSGRNIVTWETEDRSIE